MPRTEQAAIPANWRREIWLDAITSRVCYRAAIRPQPCCRSEGDATNSHHTAQTVWDHQLAHAAGAFLHLPWHCCDGLVVVGYAGYLGARADRSRGETGMRFLLAVPGRPDAAQSELDCQSGADRRGSG